MELLRKILLPLELSELDTRMVRFVAGLGRYGIGEALLVNVTRMTGVEAPVAVRQERDRGRLIATLASVLTDAGVNVTGVPLGGVPHDAVIRAAQDEHVSVIVTGTHGKSALNEFVAGGVSEAIGRRSKVPVLMVPYRWLASLPSDEAAFEAGAGVFSSVVYPTDFSDVSERTLDVVKSLDGRLVGRVTAAHVVDPKELRGEQHRDALLRSDKRILSAICDELADAGLEAQASLEVGPIIAELLELGEQAEATLYVMGSHGRGVTEEIFAGSVSQNIVRVAGRPVLITH